MISFSVPGKIQAKERPRINRYGSFYTPNKTHSSENTIRIYAKTAMHGQKPLDGYIKVTISIMEKPPESWSKKRKQDALAGEHFPTRGDLDNKIKSCLDGCNGIVFTDDKNVVYITALKSYGSLDETLIDIYPVTTIDDILLTC